MLTLSLILVGFWQPVLLLLTFGGWAWVVSEKVDKDAQSLYLDREKWGLIQIACGAGALAVMLAIPVFFLVGWVLGVLVLCGGLYAYMIVRNQKAGPNDQWNPVTMFQKRAAERQREKHVQAARVWLLTKDEKPIDIPAGEDPFVEAHAATEEVIDFALPRGGDRIDILVDANAAKRAVSIDGVRYGMPKITPAVAVKMIDYLKKAARLDLEDRRKRQVGRIHAEHEDHGRHPIEVETSGSTRGLRATLRIHPDRQRQIPFDELGLLPPQKAKLKPVIEQTQGVVLIAGPKGSGVSTTLYSMLGTHDPYTSSVVTLEDQIEHEVEGVDHNLIPPDASATQVAERLAAVLRGDPAVIMMSRLHDPSVAKQLAEAAERMRVYIPLEAPDAMGALKQWAAAVGSIKPAAESLRAIFAQRLVRQLCPVCKAAYTPDPEALQRLGLPSDKVGRLYRASGKVRVKDETQTCGQCYGIGYRGRTAVYEAMVLDDEARRLLAGNDTDGYRAHLRKQKTLFLQEAALGKVVEGQTDIKEVTRAMGEKKTSKRR